MRRIFYVLNVPWPGQSVGFSRNHPSNYQNKMKNKLVKNVSKKKIK